MWDLRRHLGKRVSGEARGTASQRREQREPRWQAGLQCGPLRLQAATRGAGRVLCVPQAAYLQRMGVSTAVFERRHVIGGAAVTEEIIPGEPGWWSGGRRRGDRQWPPVTVFM